MSLRLLLRDAPSRAFAILTETHALVFRHSQSGSGALDKSNGGGYRASPPKGMVEFAAINEVDLSDYRLIRPSGVHGTLGLISVNTDVFLCLITDATRTATIRPGETVQRIRSVEFHCMNRSDYDQEFGDDLDNHPNSSNGFERYQGAEATFEHPCNELKKMLSDGTFYYSVDCDLTNRLQDRVSDESAFDIDNLDDGFLWNSYMIGPLIKFRSRLAAKDRALLDASRILTSAVRGFVYTMTIPASSSPVRPGRSNLPSSLTLISRLSCRRAGTRFNSRGIDDDGNTANFVETETVLWHPSGLCFSYAQIRGSVPIFWEQAAGLIPGQQKIQITRSPEATQPAFDKHFESLEACYGIVHILNLLSESKPGEAELTARYRFHVKHSGVNQGIELGGTAENKLLDSQFDFHAETRGPSGYEAASMIRHLISARVDGFAYFLCEAVENRSAQSALTAMNVILQQQGIFRTNCLDCLDRTNLIQGIISQMSIEMFLRDQGERALADIWNIHSSLWADNGDALSKIYAGTGALKSSFTRHGKMSLAGAIADARKSATRMYINNFADKGRQNTIDMLLGRLIDQPPVQLYDPVTDFVNSELKRRMIEYSTSAFIQVWVGTFNLNGRSEGSRQDLRAWLCPQMAQSRPDIVAVGFQEMVELSPQQIMSTDPIRRQIWEESVQQTLNNEARKYGDDPYVLLRSGQLVGAALLIFAKSGLLGKIKNVEGSVKKTGMSGMAGNKGAVAIRMDFANTGLCFVTAHLAAGFANYEERNRDYRTISHGLRFQRNRAIDDHDTIIWLGDFNYRIGLSDDKVRRLISQGDLDTLYQNDQLNLQMEIGNVFQYYSESKISFLPTYKYDNGTDNYDSSEKSRIPAWCDRVLRRGDLKQTSYSTAPLRFSDHRPVYATFQCTISDVDEAKKERLSHEIYAMRKADVGDVVANATDDDALEDEDLIGLDPIAPELPPASSDQRKWWLDNGLPARSGLKSPNDQSVLNGRRPLNPFTPTTEPDWVPKPRYSDRGTTIEKNSTNSPRYDQQGRRDESDAPKLPSRSRAGIGSMSPDQVFRGRMTPPGAVQPTSQRSPDPPNLPSMHRKPAPPVPEKPLLLSKSISPRQTPSESLPGRPSQSPASRQSIPGAAVNVTPQSPDHARQIILPSRTISSNAQNQTREPYANPPEPSLPPRRAIDRKPPTGLMDEDIEDKGTIPSLRPTPHR